jgi:hypothetical protein
MKRNILQKVDSLVARRNVNHSWLAFLRIAIGVYCLIHFLSLLPDINIFLSENGLIAPDMAAVRASDYVPTLHSLSKKLADGLVTPQFINNFAILYCLSLVMLIAGVFTRFSAMAAAFLHLVLLNSMNFYVYGADFFCSILLFYCFLFPTGYQYSVDSKLFPKRKFPVVYANYCLLMLQVHVCIAYFFGGFDKMLGFNWWDGESIWKAMHMYEAPRLIDLNPLGHTPAFAIIGWLTIITEMLYPVFINIKKTRKVWLAMVIGMHLGIAMFLGLFFFSTLMILLNVCAYYFPYLAEKAPAVSGKKSKPLYTPSPAGA